jgi:DNA-binding transcriptional ArsR family regulator
VLDSTNQHSHNHSEGGRKQPAKDENGPPDESERAVRARQCAGNRPEVTRADLFDYRSAHSFLLDCRSVYASLVRQRTFPLRWGRLTRVLTAGTNQYIIDVLYNLTAMNPSQRLDATFSALADPTRRAILARLASGEVSVLELAKPFAMSQPAISRHLKVLERAGLISRGRDAQRRPCRLEAKPLAEANGWLEHYRQFWEGSFQRLDLLLDEMKSNEKRRTRTKRGSHR